MTDVELSSEWMVILECMLGFLMQPAVVAALIAAVVSLTLSQWTTYINTITTARIKWLTDLRDAVSLVLELSNRLMDDAIYNSDGSEECIRIRSSLRKEINRTCLLLNPDDSLSQDVIAYGKIVEKKSENKYEWKHSQLVCHNDEEISIDAEAVELRRKVQQAMKIEWEKIKEESTLKWFILSRVL